ncbi:CrcB family protein [Leuconostocaceae bacterium ESL0958]|nr:CrcB family protein [Leuconostocaceae bacterium ESL0958]
MLVKEEWTAAMVVFLGGMLGGGLRYLLTAIPQVGASIWMTWLINVTGTFALAYLGAYMKASQAGPRFLQAFLGTGLLGGYTTFGTLMSQFRTAGAAQGQLLAWGYLAATLFAALAAVYLAEQLVQQRFHREERHVH